MDENKIQNLIQDEINNTVPFMIEAEISNHTHDGGGSKILEGKNLSQAPQPALTSADNSGLSSGGTYTLRTSDAVIINNMRTRVNEFESRLKALGLLN